MKKNLYYIVYIGVLMMLLAGCQDEGLFTPEEETSETPVNVSFRVKLGGEEMSRAIGDASLVNELIVGVFQDSKLLKTFTYTRKEGEDKFTDVKIPLFKNQTYDLAFWAQVSDNGIYSIDENFNITIDYSKYKDISLAGTEAFEAFSAIRTGVTVAQPGDAEITLTRPFAQLNIAASEEDIFNNVDATRFTISKVYTTYHPFSGVVGDAVEQEFSFTFTQDDLDAKQSTQIDNNTYYYLASAYLLAPEKVDMTGGLYKGEAEYKELSFKDLPLAANVRTNIYGNMIQQEVMQGWDGVTFANLSDEGLTCQVQIEGATNVLHIDTPEELAYCMKNGYPSGYDAIHICANHHMGGHEWDNVKNVPNGIIIDGASADGRFSYAISHVKLQGTTTGLFGNTEDLKVSNLQLKDFEVNTASDMAGVLAGTVKGNSSFANVVIDGCQVVADYGNAGGMVGRISRKNEKERTETLSVSFNGCQVNNTTISASAAEGIFVGELSGYDNQETLSFDAECSAENTTITDYASSYLAENQSVWLEAVETKYDNWLGTETYRRGVVKFGDVQLVPKWDGKTTVEPLAADKDLDEIDSGKVVYSPSDLAWFQEKDYTTANVYLRSDLDMGGSDNENAPIFKPISTMQYLDGLKKGIQEFTSFNDCYKIHNLKVVKVHSNGNGAAFILTGARNHIHQNIVFDGSRIISRHDETITDINDSNYGNAYAGTIVCKVTGDYKVTNVLIQNGSVNGICKMGVLLGYCTGNLQATNCIVDQCTITNYDPQCINWYTQREDIESLNMVAYAKDSFFTDGEVGGLIGFITACSPTITDCSVKNTTIDCTGEDNKVVSIGVYSANNFDENNPGSPIVKGNVTIAGRHVNQFIGDIRTQNATDVITINNPYVENNVYLRDENEYYISKTETKTKTNEWSEGSGWGKKNYRTYDCLNSQTSSSIIGCAYVVAVTLKIDFIIHIDKHVGDYKGTIRINNTRIAESSSESSEVTTGTESGFLTSYNCTYNWTYRTIKNPSGEITSNTFIGDDFSL